MDCPRFFYAQYQAEQTAISMIIFRHVCVGKIRKEFVRTVPQEWNERLPSCGSTVHLQEVGTKYEQRRLSDRKHRKRE